MTYHKGPAKIQSAHFGSLHRCALIIVTVALALASTSCGKEDLRHLHQSSLLNVETPGPLDDQSEQSDPGPLPDPQSNTVTKPDPSPTPSNLPRCKIKILSCPKDLSLEGLRELNDSTLLENKETCLAQAKEAFHKCKSVKQVIATYHSSSGLVSKKDYDRQPSDEFLITSDGVCLQSDGEMGDSVITADCTKAASQSWRLWPSGLVTSSAKGLCLASSHGKKGDRLLLRKCRYEDDQKWSFKNNFLGNDIGLKIQALHSFYGSLIVKPKNTATLELSSVSKLPTSCWITLPLCPNAPSLVSSWFKDQESFASYNRRACLARAQQYATLCGASPDSSYTVSAYFGVQGNYPAKKSVTVDKVKLVFDCSELGIKNAAAVGNMSLDCSGQIIEVASTIQVSGNGFLLNGTGAQLKWIGAGNCSQNETGSAIIDVTGSYNVISGFEIVNAPDGIHVRSGDHNILDRLIFNDVCEDAITNGGRFLVSSTNTVVKNCVFKNALDKAIQVNGGTVTIQDNTFENVGKAVATGGSEPIHYNGSVYPPQKKTITAKRNSITKCNAAGMRVSGTSQATGKLIAEDNEFKNCCPAFLVTDQGTLEQKNNHFENCENPVKRE